VLCEFLFFTNSASLLYFLFYQIYERAKIGRAIFQFAEGGTSQRDLGCGKWKNLSASAPVKPGAYLENKKFHFKCTKFPKMF